MKKVMSTGHCVLVLSLASWSPPSHAWRRTGTFPVRLSSTESSPVPSVELRTPERRGRNGSFSERSSDQGLPDPEVQYVVRDADGRLVTRCDLA